MTPVLGMCQGDKRAPGPVVQIFYPKPRLPDVAPNGAFNALVLPRLEIDVVTVQVTVHTL